MANEVRIRATLDDKVSGPLTKVQDRFDVLGKSKGFQSIVSGVGLGIGVGIWQQATSSIVGFLGDAVQAGLDEEASIQKLGTALRANIKDWNGNTDAIEKTIASRVKLGFSDDEQRDSLAKLVAATHDANKALDVQAVAMDLARFKGISLGDATDALTKVEAGSYRILKSLGIVLKDGATQTEALAAVEKVAANQAEDFANTTKGKLLVAQTEVGEAMEKFGTAVLPLVGEGLTEVANVAEDVATALDGLQRITKLTSGEQADLGQSLIDLAAAVPFVGTGFEGLAKGVHEARDETAKAAVVTEDFAQTAHGSFLSVSRAVNSTTDAAVHFREKYLDVTGDAIRASHKVRDALADDAQSIIDSYFDPLETRADIYDAHNAVLAANEARRRAKSKSDAKAASNDIIQALDDEASALDDLGRQGALTQADMDTYEKDVIAAFKAMGLKVPAEVQKQIDRLRLLGKQKPKPKVDTSSIDAAKKRTDALHRALDNLPDRTNIKVILQLLQQAAGRGAQEHAMGAVGLVNHAGGAFGMTNGPMVAPDGGVMGEAGTEAFAILRNPKRIPPGGMGAGPTFQVNVYAGAGSGLSPGDARKLAQQIGPALYGDMQRKGYLPRGTGLT